MLVWRDWNWILVYSLFLCTLFHLMLSSQELARTGTNSQFGRLSKGMKGMKGGGEKGFAVEAAEFQESRLQ
jgi:hypothetical protein